MAQATPLLRWVRLSLWALVILAHGTARSAEISFRNDVMAVLSKAGCNLGTCHGNARGKGGFQISLRGQSPAEDHAVLTRDWLSRRINPTDPDSSLLLRKPTMQVAHEGGRRFTRDSDEYRILRDWIAAGAPNDSLDAPRLTDLQVTPHEAYLVPEAEGQWTVALKVTATFSSGQNRDVTSHVVYESSAPIAEISPAGRVRGLRPGETTILVRYLHRQVPVRLAFLQSAEPVAWSMPAPVNRIDELVDAKLNRLRIEPSPVCDDATFVRRVTLDLTGQLPTADSARRFVAESSLTKRADLIDELLARPEFADWWALKWADLLRVEEKTLDRKGVENFHGWLRDQFAINRPLDQLIREIVAARGSTYEVPPANFYRALRTPFERSEAAGQLFLGVRLQCAKCHNHPFDRWTQDDYYSWGSLFSRVDYKILENNRRDQNDKHEFDGEQIVFLGDSRDAKDPRTGDTRPPQFLGDPQGLTDGADPLRALADWMTSPRNERFAQMLANRTWQQVMGQGIVDPVDDFRATNPPSNPELLDALVEELRAPARGTPFDLRHLLRLIVNSRTYQAAAEPTPSNREDETNFSHPRIRRLSAEQLLDATSQVLDVPLRFGGYPVGPRAVQLPAAHLARRREGPPTAADQYLVAFGKPPRLQNCDCERSDETTLAQTFQLVSGQLIHQMLSDPRNRIGRLAESGRPPAEVVTELYWTALTRSPTAEELAYTEQALQSASTRRRVLEDLAWGLLNSSEFLLRH